MATETKQEKAGITSLRIYLGDVTETAVNEIAEQIADLLVDRGFNLEGTVTAVIACEPGAPDVEAFAAGAESFITHMNSAAWVLIPDPDPEMETDLNDD